MRAFQPKRSPFLQLSHSMQTSKAKPTKKRKTQIQTNAQISNHTYILYIKIDPESGSGRRTRMCAGEHRRQVSLWNYLLFDRWCVMQIWLSVPYKLSKPWGGDLGGLHVATPCWAIAFQATHPPPRLIDRAFHVPTLILFMSSSLGILWRWSYINKQMELIREIATRRKRKHARPFKIKKTSLERKKNKKKEEVTTRAENERRFRRSSICLPVALHYVCTHLHLAGSKLQ